MVVQKNTEMPDIPGFYAPKDIAAELGDPLSSMAVILMEWLAWR